MALPSKSANSETPSAAGRRSTRLAIAIPICLSGRDSSGAAFKENTRTITVNKHGAKVSTSRQLTLGAEVLIENRHFGTTARANVVWLGERKGPKDPLEIGIQLAEASNVWGIEFPPEDWQESPPAEPAGLSLDKARTPPPAKPLESAGPAQAADGAAAATPRAVAPPKPPPPPPQPPRTGPAFSPQLTETVIGSAVERINQQAEKAVEDYSKAFEEKVARTVQDLGFQSQAQLQQAANALEEKLIGSLDAKLAALGEKLETSKSEFEALLGRYKELQQSGASEVEKTKQDVEAAAFAAPQSAIEQLRQAVEKEIREAQQEFVDQTRKRVGEEAAASMEKFSQDASARLAQLTEQQLSRVEPDLREHEAKALEELTERTEQIIRAAHEDFQDHVRKVCDEALPAVRNGVQGLAAREAEARRGEFVASVEKELGGRSVAAVESFSREAHERLSRLSEELLARTETELQTRGIHAGERTAEEVRKAMEAATAAGLKSLEKAYSERVASFDAQLEKTAKKAQEKTAMELSEHLARTKDELLASETKEFQKSLSEARGELKDELKTIWKSLAEEAKKQLGSMTAATVDLLNKEAKTGLDEFRRHLKESAHGSLARAARELEVELQKAAESQRQEILEQTEKQIAESGTKILSDWDARKKQAVEEAAQAFEQLQTQMEKEVKEASEAVNKHVGSGAVFLKELEEHARAGLETLAQKMEGLVRTSEGEFEQRAAEFSAAAMQGFHGSADVLLEQFQQRLQKAADAFSATCAESLEKRLQDVSEKVVEESAAQLTKQSQEGVELLTAKLDEQKEKVVNEAEEALRSKLAELFASVFRPGGRRATDRAMEETKSKL